MTNIFIRCINYSNKLLIQMDKAEMLFNSDEFISTVKIYLLEEEEMGTKSNVIKTNYIKTSINVTEKFKPIQYKECT